MFERKSENLLAKGLVRLEIGPMLYEIECCVEERQEAEAS